MPGVRCEPMAKSYRPFLVSIANFDQRCARGLASAPRGSWHPGARLPVTDVASSGGPTGTFQIAHRMRNPALGYE